MVSAAAAAEHGSLGQQAARFGMQLSEFARVAGVESSCGVEFGVAAARGIGAQPADTLYPAFTGCDRVGLKLFAEMFAGLPVAHPGCLAASFAYQDQLFNRDIRTLNADGILAWRKRFRERFEIIAALYPVDFDALADMAVTLVEGGLLTGRMLNDNSVLPKSR